MTEQILLGDSTGHQAASGTPQAWGPPWSRSKQLCADGQGPGMNLLQPVSATRENPKDTNTKRLKVARPADTQQMTNTLRREIIH